jgi:4-nitrophenyl phosphatase
MVTTAPAAWAFDLDGVVWTGRRPIPGSADAVNRVIASGADVVFVTNNSAATVDQQEAKLASFGVDARGRVVTSAMAGASLVDPGDTVFVLGGPGIVEAVEHRGARSVEQRTARESVDHIDAVIVGLDRELSYERLTTAVLAVRAGARLIATNHDPTYPTEFGLYPGGGSIVAAVETATERSAVVAGKPNEAQAKLVSDRLGTDGLMVGDRPDTDGAFARAIGFRFGLVLTGVTSQDDLPVEPAPQVVAQDLRSLVKAVLDPGVS